MKASLVKRTSGPGVALIAAVLCLAPGCQIAPNLDPIKLPGAPLPADVDPVSLSRMAPVERDNLDELGQQLYDKLSANDPNSAKRGPGGLSLHSPRVAEAMNLLNSYLRGDDSILGKHYTELAILVAAREMDQAYEWSGHEPTARAAGVDDYVIDVIKNDLDIVGMGPEDSNIILMGRQLFRQHRLTSDVWARAVQYHGEQGAFELTAVMGDYAMAALMLNAVDQQIPPERTATLPARPGYPRE